MSEKHEPGPGFPVKITNYAAEPGLVEAKAVKEAQIKPHPHNGWLVFDWLGRLVGHHASKDTAEEQAKELNK